MDNIVSIFTESPLCDRLQKVRVALKRPSPRLDVELLNLLVEHVVQLEVVTLRGTVDEWSHGQPHWKLHLLALGVALTINEHQERVIVIPPGSVH